LAHQKYATPVNSDSFAGQIDITNVPLHILMMFSADGKRTIPP
jgi:hypothetical protein